MRFLLFFSLLILPGCQQESTQNEGPVRTEAALIYENGLAYDGCAEHIQLLSDSLLYRPTPATLPLLQKALTDIPRQPTSNGRAITIRFVNTGQQTTLECGWGKKSQVGELEVLEITKR
ncbi:hypothetical protein [Spirosoma luteum]|uniref:hypothetical protein n=1 Tax=Spirosoma luteum TaxID=431553 RepID=UPI000374B221|nr:hypothetical protein [Spirosoma luteum]